MTKEASTTTKIFISWSLPRAQHVAKALRALLEQVNHPAVPWLSSSDIEVGKRWNDEIATELEQTNFGICVVTPENMNRPWVLFEAGALAKHLAKARLIPLLVGFDGDLPAESPLSAFQSVHAQREGVWSIVNSVNAAIDAKRSTEALKEAFDAFWPKLETAIREAATMTGDRSPPPRTREEDILLMLFDVSEQLGALKQSVDTLPRPIPGIASILGGGEQYVISGGGLAGSGRIGLMASALTEPIPGTEHFGSVDDEHIGRTKNIPLAPPTHGAPPPSRKK